MKSIFEVLQRPWLYKTLTNTSSMLILFGLYRWENPAGLLCSWHKCSRAWQCRRVKTIHTYDRRGRMLHTLNRLITACGLMGPPWFPILNAAIKIMSSWWRLYTKMLNCIVVCFNAVTSEVREGDILNVDVLTKRKTKFWRNKKK